MTGRLFNISAASPSMLAPGDDAPGFTAPDQDGDPVSLADIPGRVILYVYPKDDTPGCTREACAFRDAIDRFADRDITVLGVSTDTVASHAAFAEDHDLPFPLLADPDRDVIDAYDVPVRNGHAARVTYVIGPDRTIERVYPDVDPETHVDTILADLEGA